jgi:hypothetical protein
VGFANGLFGAGGGALLVPALSGFMGYTTRHAHATALAVMLPLSVLSAVYYTVGVEVDWTAVLYVSGGGIAGGVIGAKLLNKLSSLWLRRLFAVFMAAAAVRMMLSADALTQGVALFEGSPGYLYAAAGFAAGVISGMGIGGGAVLIPLLGIFMGMGQREAQHINLLYFLPTAAVAVFIHARDGNIIKKGLTRLVLLGLAGAAAGAFLAFRMDADWLRRGFGLFLLGIGIREFTRKERDEEDGTAKLRGIKEQV